MFIAPHILFPSSSPPPATYDEVTDMIADSVPSSTITQWLKYRYRGSAMEPGATEEVIPDPDYANHPWVLAPHLGSARNEVGVKAIRLTKFDSSQPTSGSSQDLRSERSVACFPNSSNVGLFFSKPRTNWLLVTEVDLVSKDVLSQFDRDISFLTNDEKLLIHPHPTLQDEVFYQRGGAIYRRNLRTWIESLIVNLGFTPDPDWANQDGNAVYNECILLNEAANKMHVWIFHIPSGMAVNIVNGSRVFVPVSLREVTVLPDSGDPGSDHAYTDGTFIYAVIKGGAGPDSGSGNYIYAGGTWTGHKVFGTAGHYGHHPQTVGAETHVSHSVKMNPGNEWDFGGAYSRGDHITIACDLEWNGSGWDLTRNGVLNLEWTYGVSNASGGQHSGLDAYADWAFLTMKAAYSSTTETEANYITSEFFGKEVIMEFDLTQVNGWRNCGKNLTRFNKPTNLQTEGNLLWIGPDGTKFYVIHSRIGPPEGSSTWVQNSKDEFLMILPPRTDQATYDSYVNP